MATSGSQEAICRLVKDGTMELQTEVGRTPYYKAIAVHGDMLMIVDWNARNLQLYSRHDGNLLSTSHRLETIPYGACLFSKTEVALCLLDSMISIMSFESIDDVKLVKTLNLRSVFDECHSVAKWNSTDKLVVSGLKYEDGWMLYDDDMILSWAVVSITDGCLYSPHKVCKGDIDSWSHLAIQDNTVYLSCWTRDSTVNGVYAYDIFNPQAQKFLYQHQELKRPDSIMVDGNFIYVCDLDSNRIHQLTDSGQLVTIHTLSSRPREIFYDDQHGVLYTTRHGSNEITVYRREYIHQPGVPIEILNMDHRSIQLFEEALKDGKETVYSMRIMVVGQMGVGKTTLVKRLLGEEVNISERRSTEGIDVYVNCCDVSLSTHEWKRQANVSGQDCRLQRIARVLNEQQSMKDKVVDKGQSLILPQGGKILKRLDGNVVAVEDKDTDGLYHHSALQDISQDLSSTASQQDIGQDLSSTASQQDIGQDLSSTTSQQTIHQDLSSTTSQYDSGQNLVSTASQQGSGQNLSSTTSQHDSGQNLSSTASQQDLEQDLSYSASQLEGSPSTCVQMKSTKSETNTTAMLKLLKENVNKLESTGKTSLMTIWDFAGQYAFYTTHQTFLTRRAIYLLVSDVSGHVTDLVADECYFDSDGITMCKVHELVEVWLNSIHSCAPSHDASNPPVILVGTHVDKISKKLSQAKDKDSEKAAAVGFTSATTSTLTSTATSEKSRTVKKFVKPRKIDGIVKETPVSSLTSALALPAEDNLKKKRKQSMRPWKKKKKVKATESVDAEKSKHHEICETYFREIRSYLEDKPTRFHLIDEDFAVDNTIIDRRLEDLKRKIVEVASQQPYWGEVIPARWLPLEHELMMRKAAGVKVISREDVDKINKEGTVPIEKNEELDLFLRFLHDTGTIIFFSIEVLRENIVLDPTWLIDALKLLINTQTNLLECSAVNGTQSSSPADCTIKQKWSDFKQKGILSLELIDTIWTREKHPELHAHRNHILMIMEQLNIVTKPRSFSEIGEKVQDYFLTPCMLRQETPTEVISPEQDPRLVSTPDMRYIFTGKYLPTPIFHRLIAACVARWPVAKKKETSENLIFCGCCVFDLDLFHRLTVYIKNHVVFARITRMVVNEVKIPDAKLCSRVRKFITLNLSKITSYLGQNLQYELRVQSPPYQMWHAEEGHDPDAPITPEHMNHARLCVALVTVCGKALRDILLTYFPVPYKDIYQAILANKVNLTKRQGRPLLNSDQIQLVFPDPQRQTTGTVDQFDLSLLYTLIRNVSTVPAPHTGWGNDPQDQPRDKSLEASVERIRSYRNHISGHSPDGKISRQDLEDYWNRFEAVLHDIEAVLGGQAYSQELEKQRRQVISIYEAC